MDMQVKVCESSLSTEEDLTVPDSFTRRRLHKVWRPKLSNVVPQEFTYRRYNPEFSTPIRRLALRRRIREQQQNRKLPVPQPRIPSWVADFACPSVSDYSVIPVAETSNQTQAVQVMMSTIKEEMPIPKIHSNNPIKKPKGLEDKMTALQLVVGRLHKMCLEKPEAVENTLPEETIQQFKEIRL